MIKHRSIESLILNINYSTFCDKNTYPDGYEIVPTVFNNHQMSDLIHLHMAEGMQ